MILLYQALEPFLSPSVSAIQLEIYQQTISDWEVGAHKPQKAMSKLLTLIAKEAEFKYGDAD